MASPQALQVNAHAPSRPALDTFPKLLLNHAAVRQSSRHAGKRPGHLANLELGRGSRRGARHCLRSGCARFARGDRLAIIGDNRPRLYWSMAAAQCLGGVPVPLYQDAVAEEMVFCAARRRRAFAVVEDQEQVDKLLKSGDRLPTLTHIIYDDPRGMRHYQHDGLHSFAEVLGDGRVHHDEHPHFSRAKWTASAPTTSPSCCTPRAPPAIPRAWRTPTTA